MKAVIIDKTQPNTFTPFDLVITVESLGELKALEARLNVAFSAVKQSLRIKDGELGQYVDHNYPAWKRLNERLNTFK